MASLPSGLKKLQAGTGLRDYLSVILRRKTIIIVSFLSVLISTVYYVFKIEDIYEAYSTLVIEDQITYVNQMMTTNPRPLDFFEGILCSRTFLETVLDSIGLDEFTKIFPKFTREDALEYIQANISLKKTTFTSFLRFDVRAKTKDLAYKIACVGTELFRIRCQEVSSEESRRAVVEIDKQLQMIRAKLEEAEHDYRSFGERTGQILEEGTTPELKNLQEAYATSQAQLGVKKADLDAEKKQLTLLEEKIEPPEQIRSPEYLQLRARLRDLEREKIRLEGLGIRLAGISTIDREIQDIESNLLQYKNVSNQTVDPATIRQWQELRKSVISKEADLDLFKKKLESYDNAIKSYKGGHPDILSQSLELLRLKRSKEIYENVYNILLAKAEEERIKSTSSSAGIKIVDLPSKPQSPIPKNETRFYLFGILLGLILGFGLAFLIEFNDTTIKSNEDIEKYLELPVLGTIPHISHNRKNDIEIKRKTEKSGKGQSIHQYPRAVFNFDGDDSVITESYRALRTNLTFTSPDKSLQTIALTSAGPSEGKSLTISNLATAYAQMGKKTLLIDTDLRRPVLHHIFNEKREPGFTDLFIDNPEYTRIIKKTEKDNLFLITAGMFTPNPAELMASNKMAHLLDYLRSNYDVIFFDTPPIVAVTDATLLGTKLDGLLLIIKSHHTDKDVALRAVNILRNVGVRVLGTVLNDINLSHRYSSYGYYKYYYHYYKSKKD